MTDWTKEAIIQRLIEIERKGYIAIPKESFRNDDGIGGQILEREFGVKENNLHSADLKKYELKGLRYKKSKPNMLTLFHQKPVSGMTVNQIFDRFGYIRKSKRSDILKKKLFTTISGNKYNNLGFILKAKSDTEICLYHKDEYLATWNLSEAANKINNVVLALADTQNKTNSSEETFHYIEAYLLENRKSLADAITAGAVVMDLCIDQPADKSKGIHDRGPHIRIPVKKLSYLYDSVERIL